MYIHENLMEIIIKIDKNRFKDFSPQSLKLNNFSHSLL